MKCECCKGFFRDKDLKNYIRYVRRSIVFVQQDEQPQELTHVKYCAECVQPILLDRMD